MLVLLCEYSADLILTTTFRMLLYTFHFKCYYRQIISQSYVLICKRRNGESGNGMRGMIGTRRISVRKLGTRVGTRGIKMGIRGITVGIQGIREFPTFPPPFPATLIPRIPILIPGIPTLISRVHITPRKPFPDSPFRLLQIATRLWSSLEKECRRWQKLKIYVTF